MDTAKDQNEQGNPQPSETPVESDKATSDLELPQISYMLRHVAHFD